jgi:hypothetical protein
MGKPTQDVYRPCPCGSGEKYKFCCLQRDRESRRAPRDAGPHREPELVPRGASSEAKRCGLCGRSGRLTRTECCGRFICDDEDQYVLFSYATNSCHRNHRRYTLCGSHHVEGHSGRWQDCGECRDGTETEMYVWYGTNDYNFEKLTHPPAYDPTKCSSCKAVIVLGDGGYSTGPEGYLCPTCTTKEFGRMV